MKHKLPMCRLLTLSLVGLAISINTLALTGLGINMGVSFSNESVRLQSFERHTSTGVYGTAWLDYDADGDLDLFIPNRAGSQNALFENIDNGEFSDVTIEAGLADFNGYTSVVAGDIDNDGYPDLYLAGEGGLLSVTTPSRLYHNNGDGTFSDISATSNTPGTKANGSVAMADFNNDGLLDIFVTGAGHIGVFVPPFFPAKNILYINNGDLTFTDVTESAGINTALGSCATQTTDHNNDGWMDIIVADCLTSSFNIGVAGVFHLYENNKDGTFTDIAGKVGLDIVGAWIGLSLGDYDNDGDFDIFATSDGLFSVSILLRKNNDGTYSDVTPSDPSFSDFGWGTTFADWDNDGDVDLFYAGNWMVFGQAGNTGHMYFNDGRGNLVEDTQALGVDLGAIQASGMARADYNGDGFMDMVVVTEAYQMLDPNTGEVIMSGPGYPYLFKNNGNNNSWVTIRPEGTASNRMGIGAKLTLYTHSGRQIREVAAGSSFASSETPWPIFGMGHSRVGLLKVDWPSGKKELFVVWNGKSINIIEGRGFSLGFIRHNGILDDKLQKIVAKFERKAEKTLPVDNLN